VKLVLPRVAVIMAGGGGARLWPASTPDRPKQLTDPLLERASEPRGKSLLARTVTRLLGVVDLNDVWVVTATDQRSGVMDAVPDLPAQRIVGEPCGRNTAAAIALSAIHLRASAGASDLIVMVLPADHHIASTTALARHLRGACAIAEHTGAIVTLGITPTTPSNAYGYIERTDDPGASVPGDEGVASYGVSRFVEKPPEALARMFLESGRFLWNSGIFVMRLSRIERDLELHCPQTWTALRPVARALERGDLAGAYAESERAYASIPAVPIDVAVMEKTDHLSVVPAAIEWTDLGSWDAVYAAAPKDEHGNVRLCAGPETVLIDAHGCLTWSDRAQIAVIGLDDIAVVQCEDRVLVMPRNKAQDVRWVLRALRDRGAEQ